MESAQRELLGVLLGQLRERGVLSQSTYSSAMDLVHSDMDIPKLLRYPVCLPGEGRTHEYSQDPQ